VRTSSSFPLRDIGQHDPRPHHSVEGKASVHHGVRDVPKLLRDFEELQAAGFITDENPEDILLDVKEEFVAFLTPLLQGPKGTDRLRERLGSRDWKPYNMFRDKIARGLIDLLEPKGLVRQANDYEVEFDASIVNVRASTP
jgi:hypothetical protein